MILKNNFIKFFFLLSLIIIFALDSVQAKKKHFKKIKKVEGIAEEKSNKDKFYLVYVKNNSKGKKVKRDEKEKFLDSLVTEINKLIIENKDTYDDQSKLEELEQATTSSNPIRKRGENEGEDENKYAYLISSLEKESLIYSYLSEDVVTKVKELSNVIDIIPDFEVDVDGQNINLESLKNIDNWKYPCVRGNTYNHLSLISQDKYNDNDNGNNYDSNYYFPRTYEGAANIFIIDSGFNFRHPEFSNNSERIARCVSSIDSNCQVTDPYSDPNFDYTRCIHNDGDLHGRIVSDVAGGLTSGVASEANIYGIEIYGTRSHGQYITALEYIRSNYLDDSNSNYNIKKGEFKYKTVINLSSSFNSNNPSTIDYYRNLIEDMSNKGCVFVAAAGNTHELVDDYHYPCTFDNVICVGAIDNIGINQKSIDKNNIKNNKSSYSSFNQWNNAYQKALNTYYMHLYNSNYYKGMYFKNYEVADFSNYGKNVNIHAPGYVEAFYQNNTGIYTLQDSGTSYSSPIVAGVVATIIQEYPNVKFTSKKMLTYLNDRGLKNIINGIPNGNPNVFVNNGKRLTFNRNSNYDICGRQLQNNICSNGSNLTCLKHGCCYRY